MFKALDLMPLEFRDFNGGITDNYLDGRINQYQRADNFVITDNKKLLTRPGSAVADTTNYLPGYLVTNPRVGALFDFESLIWEYNARGLYYNNSGYATQTGPTGNPALPAGTSTSKLSWAYWNRHLFVTNDALGSPQKIYRDGSNVLQIRNAGLPKLASAPTIAGSNQKVYDFAIDLKAKYNAHLADAAQHTSGVDATHTLSSASPTTLASLITLINEMITKFPQHEADSQLAAAWVYHKAKAVASRQLASVIAPVTISDCVTRLIDIAAKFNAHDADGVAHGVASSHQESLTSPAVHTYIYTFIYTYTYTIGTVTFKDLSTTKQVTLSSVDSPSDNAVSITAIPVIANGATENWDTTVITVEIYRTIDAGQTSYLVGSVTNGTTTYSDTTSDTTLQTATTLYTAGGVYDYDPPPKAKYLSIANDIGWYAHVQEGTQVVPNRVRQSIKFDPDSCPESFYVDMEDDITGISNIGIYPIVFCKKRIYRLEGFYDSQGRGIIDKREISRTVGCVSNLSIVITRDGLFFAGNDGFYYTDGYQVLKISQELNTTYKTLIVTDTQKGNIYGTFEPYNNRVWWGVQRDQSSGDNDACFIADLKFGIKADTPFTTASGGSSFAPTALLFPLTLTNNNYLYRADKRGYLFRHDDTLYVDPKVDVLAVPSAWQTKTLIYDYTQIATDFGAPNVRKWVPKIVLYAKNLSNVSIAINGYNNDSVYARPTKEVRLASNILWGDATLNWGDATLIWNYDQMIKAERRFPAGGLRCDYKQVQFTNSYTLIANSDNLGTGTVDATAKTVTLLTAPTSIWPSDCVDYYISFLADNYATDYLVTARTDSVITYSDPLGVTASAVGTKWEMKGYRKNDVLNILNYTLFFGLLSDNQDAYHTSNTGANA